MTQAPTFEQVFRFFAAITPKLQSHIPNKDCISRDTLVQGVAHLSETLTFRHDFKFTRQDAARLDNLLNSMVKDGMLFKGKFRKAVHCGIVMVQRLGVALFGDALTHGTIGWDTIICKWLAISIMCAGDVRGGEVARSNGYTGAQCLCWKDVHLRLQLGTQGTSVQDFCANVVFRFEKGKK